MLSGFIWTLSADQTVYVKRKVRLPEVIQKGIDVDVLVSEMQPVR